MVCGQDQRCAAGTTSAMHKNVHAYPRWHSELCHRHSCKTTEQARGIGSPDLSIFLRARSETTTSAASRHSMLRTSRTLGALGEPWGGLLVRSRTRASSARRAASAGIFASATFAAASTKADLRRKCGISA
eukprot:INCI10410.2.p3 GENE.INCI10410.2~~INCI10410.2.p3  ORF type:complete len:131 (+),score=12.00 INCI10410.2:99-491(+)